MSIEDGASTLPDVILPAADRDLATGLFRQIADLSPNVILVVALSDLRIVYANVAAGKAARHGTAHLSGRLSTSLFTFLDPVVLLAKASTQVRAVAAGDGAAPLWWDVSYVFMDASAVLVTAVDVTHHELAKAEAQQAQHTLNALLDFVPQGICIARGREAVIEGISKRGLALLERGPEAVIGHSVFRHADVWDVYRPGDDSPLPPAERPLARATRTGEVQINETLLMRRPSGELSTVVCTSGPIRDAQGRATGAVMVWQEFGELQRAQLAVRESEQRLRSVLLQIPAAVFILEAPDGRVTFKSRLLDDVLGPTAPDLESSKAALRGWAVHEDGSPYDLSDYPSRRALAHGETVRAEPMTYVRSDGRRIDLEMYAGPVHSESGEIVAAVAVAMDVTERRLAESRQAFLFRLQDALRALSEPAEIITTAATLLGRHLQANRIGYSEIQADDETVLVTNGYVDGAAPVDGLFKLSMFGPHHEREMRAGRTLVYEDVQADDRGAREFGLELGTRAHVSVPLVRNGRFTGSLYVTHLKPHSWSPADVALIEDVAARIWDAAERGRAEARLRGSEERLRLALESAGLGSWEYDAVAHASIRSARHDAIFGYAEPVSDWNYEKFKAHIPESDRMVVEAGLRAALEQGKDWDVECRMVRADGSQGWLSVCARPYFGPDGQVERLLGTVADISERKRAEEAVIQTGAKFETFAQMMPIMVWTSLPDGQIDWFNARVCEYSGFEEAEIGANGWTPVHEDDVERAARSWKEALASGEPFETEYRIRRHDGMFRWHITRAVPIRNADGDIVLWIGTSADIQDQKSSEQALAELNATLEEQVRARTSELLEAEGNLRQSQKMEAVGQLTGGLAHDFNNLLTGITGSLEMLSTRIAQGRFTEVERYLTVAQGAARRAASLTHRLLAFSRRQTLEPKPTNINQLVAGMDELIRRTVGPAVTLDVVSAPGLWPVLADPNQLENALLNLCINARDAMPDGGRLTIETGNRYLDESEAKCLEVVAGEFTVLAVSDTGGGMTPEVIARAFDPFFTTKPLGEGTGLGLSMVYGFTRQSGGQACIESQPGEGATVRLYLPRYHGDDVACEIRPDPQKAQRGEGETVLVVDDEPSVRLLIQEVLAELGYKVMEAETGAAGLQILEAGGQVDLLITDVGLPGGMNGRQLADAARVKRPDLKILFITGYAESAVLGDGHLRGGMHILTKPFSLDALGGRVQEIISRR